MSIGGDSDTIAAIACGVAEGRFGLPQDIATQAWGYLPSDIRRVISDLYRLAENTKP